ncbi:MarR family winged helix-turn-helix transcriptional regulator [Streptomyces sp. NPDC059679]|uniref:MarR family winged helix-turn-helix transcriptional regulator n=1 Tax=Streptomyces sp. NPDC059679 TaxID=3346903 RepID=UPI0036908644
MGRQQLPCDRQVQSLVHHTRHQLRTVADRRCLAAAGVTTAQLGALFAVRDQPGITQRELAHALGLRESGVTALVARLAKAGLVARRAHPREHRAVVLELTDGGAAALRAAQPEIERFNGELRGLLGDQGFARTAAALHALAHWES